MKIGKLLLGSVLFLSLIATSCKEEAGSPYEGAWGGTYSGDDNGVWDVNIDKDGKLSGNARSDSFPTFPYDFEGTVDDQGQLNAEVSTAFINIIFNGNFSGNSGSGTWVDDQDTLQGTWQGTRK